MKKEYLIPVTGHMYLNKDSVDTESTALGDSLFFAYVIIRQNGSHVVGIS